MDIIGCADGGRKELQLLFRPTDNCRFLSVEMHGGLVLRSSNLPNKFPKTGDFSTQNFVFLKAVDININYYVELNFRSVVVDSSRYRTKHRIHFTFFLF